MVLFYISGYTFYKLYIDMKNKYPNINVSFVEGLPPKNYVDIFSDRKTRIIIIDDLMMELCNSKEVSNVFTKGSHHLNISIFFLTQNLFLKSICFILLLKLLSNRHRTKFLIRGLIKNCVSHMECLDPLKFFCICCGM